MKLDEYKKLIKEDEQNRRQYSREACLDRDFMTVITFFEITKHARGLRTIENILNSYKVTENVKDGEEINLTKVPKSIQDRMKYHANNLYVRKKVSDFIAKQKKEAAEKDSERE